MFHRRHRALVALFLVVAACSDDAGSPQASSTAVSRPAQQVASATSATSRDTSTEQVTTAAGVGGGAASTSAAGGTGDDAQDDDTPQLLPGQTEGLDDYNDDGHPDPTCGTQDFGAGLVLRILCDIGGRNSDPPEGVTLVDGSLFRLPTDDRVDLTGISGSAVYARDDAGGRVYVIVFNSDALFETGSDAIAAPDTFDNLVALINRSYPGSRIQVRGHTDSTGSPEANQQLSERRAESVAAYLRASGVNAGAITAVGFGPTKPLAVEDGEAAMQFNRRVELVIRPVT